MPTISVKKSWLDNKLGRNYSEEEFDALCFDYGLELSEITTDKLIADREKGLTRRSDDRPSPRNDQDDPLVYKIEVPANRYDLLCGEGIAQALRVFLNKQKMPMYKTVPGKSGCLERLIVKHEVSDIRPFVVAAILRDLTLDLTTYNSLIDLQDKLHQNLGRRRALVSIGTHDLDVIQSPFVYTAVQPDKLKFRPLNQTEEYTASEMMKLYSTDSHLRHYLHIIQDKPLYPVIFDKNNAVLSMPPIVNGDLTKLSTRTKNMLVEVTATDLTRASVVLNTLVTTFSEYCKLPFTVEPVQVQQVDGSVRVYPELEQWSLNVSVDEINNKVGVNLNAQEICGLLERMCLKAESTEADASTRALNGPSPVAGGSSTVRGAPRTDGAGEVIRVTVPPTRHDILHVCDVVEDVAVAHGFNRVQVDIPATCTIGRQFPINKLTDLLRHEIAQAGFTEVLTFSLCSRDDVWSKLRQKPDDKTVHIANPKTLDFQVARTTLLPGILKTIGFNKDVPLPLKLFEIQDVVFKDANSDVGARNERHLCAVYYSKTSGFEIIHGLLDRFMELLAVPFGNQSNGYHIEAVDDATYFHGRCAKVVGPSNAPLGKLGVLHPEVLASFDLALPCSVIEINIEPFL